MRDSINFFLRTSQATLLYLFYLQGVNQRFVGKDLNFSWGIIWSILNPLIIVIGLTVLISVGFKGEFQPVEIFLFMLLFWFGFNDLVQRLTNLAFNNELLEKNYINYLNVLFSEIAFRLIGIFLRTLICIFALSLMGLDIYLDEIIFGFMLLMIFGIFYALLAGAIISSNSFWLDIHNYALQALFFLSSIIIPVASLPEFAREILLLNPLVHIFEYMKFDVTGTYYDYISINYVLLWILILLIISPITFYRNYKIFRNKKLLARKGI